MSEYDKQAQKFLDDTGTKIDIALAPVQKSPEWANDTDSHNMYQGGTK